jgi:hypothetical protein
MPRKFSPKLLDSIENAEDSLGISLARTCLKAGLPASYAAPMLKVSRMTLHTWFRGGVIRKSRTGQLEQFIDFLKDEIRSGVLPKPTLKQTQEYAEDFAGRAIQVNKSAA